jgi:hypothetical protein
MVADRKAPAPRKAQGALSASLPAISDGQRPYRSTSPECCNKL